MNLKMFAIIFFLFACVKLIGCVTNSTSASVKSPRIFKALSWGRDYELKDFSPEGKLAYLKRPLNNFGRVLADLIHYFLYNGIFDDFDVWIFYNGYIPLPNGTEIRMTGLINRSELDVMAIPVPILDEIQASSDYAYPFELTTFTFVIAKPKYRPEIFGIFKTLSRPVWTTVGAVLLAVTLTNYVFLKHKYSLDKILLHSLAVLLRHPAVIEPSTVTENFLIYAWVIGAMFLCLAYDSVFLSFLAFPPLVQIKDTEDLAHAIQNDGYHASTSKSQAGIFFLTTKESVLVIADDLKENNFTHGFHFRHFIRDSKEQKLAFIAYSRLTEVFGREYFISDDYFIEIAASFPIRKDFCCKRELNRFIHLMMASGLYSKYWCDTHFVGAIPVLLEYSEEYDIERKLTLTDVAPAFIILLSGYILSILVLIAEVSVDRKKKRKRRKKNVTIRMNDFP